MWSGASNPIKVNRKLMFDTTKRFELEQNPLFRWKGAATCVRLVELTGPTERKGALDVLPKIKYRRYSQSSLFAIITASKGDEDYFCHFSFVGGMAACECQAFARRQGICKHVVALLVDGLSHFEDQDKSPRDWLDTIVSDARNGVVAPPWEQRPSFSSDIAEAHGATVEQIRVRIKMSPAYKLADGLYWTGPLPLPEAGDSCVVRLPTGERIDATVQDFEVSGKFKALNVLLSANSSTIPSLRSGQTMLVFGSEYENVKQ